MSGNNRRKSSQSHELIIPVRGGIGSNSILQATYGKTLSGSVTVDHGLQRIDTIPEEIVDEWQVTLLVDGNEVYCSKIANGETLNHKGIKTKFWGKTEFSIRLKYSHAWDLDAKLNLVIYY